MLSLKTADHAAVRAYLQLVATMCRPQLATPNDIKKDDRRTYLPAGFVFDPPPPAILPPDSPPLTPVFARSARYRCNQDASGVLRSYAELPERLGVMREGEILASDGDMDLSRASMIVVDGWRECKPTSFHLVFFFIFDPTAKCRDVRGLIPIKRIFCRR